MLFHFHVKRLWLNVHEGRVVDARDRLGRHQVMQVACKFGELSAGCLLLALLLFNHDLLLVVLELLAHLIILKRL